MGKKYKVLAPLGIWKRENLYQSFHKEGSVVELNLTEEKEREMIENKEIEVVILEKAKRSRKRF